MSKVAEHSAESIASSGCDAPRGYVPSAVALAAFVLLCFGRLVLQPASLIANPADPINDATRQYAALRVFPAWSWADFDSWPLWNPTLHGGAPFFANPQSGACYPLNLLFLVPGGLSALSWSLLLHAWLAGMGAIAVARLYRLSPLAALTCGICQAGAPYLIAHIYEGHHPHVSAAAWFPWCWWAWERSRLSSQGRINQGVLWLAVFLAMTFLAGHVQECYYAAFVLILTAGVDAAGAILPAVRHGRLGVLRIALQPVRRIALAGTIAMNLAAVQLLPQWLAHRESILGEGLSLKVASSFATTAHNLVQLLHPFALGNPIDDNYRGEWNYWESLVSIGTLPVFLVAWGIWSYGPGRVPLLEKRGVSPPEGLWRLVALAAFSLWFALGRKAVLFRVLYATVPGVGWFRAPGRMLFWFAFAGAMLAGHGIEALRRGEGSAAGFGRRRWMVTACVIAVCLDLASACVYLLRVVPADSILNGDPLAAAARDGEPFRVFARPAILNDASAYAHRLQKLTGYEAFQLRRTSELFWGMSGHDRARARQRYDRDAAADRRLPLRNQLLDLWNVRYLLLSGEPIPQGWRRVETADSPNLPRESIVCERIDPMPRAYVVPHALVISDDSHALDAVANIDLHREVVLAHDYLPPGARQPFTPARVRHASPNRLVVSVSIDAPGYLVLSEPFAAGWSATDNGSAVTVYRANYGLRAVPLGRGMHEIVLHYWPPGLTIGAVLSGVTWVAVVLRLFWEVKRDRGVQ